ncbi:S-adenosyl-L-methionine-dependent methyltransferase, partial [Patellaria atrata CBS 101060]
MPRLPYQLLRHAHRIDSNLPTLLKSCRDLDSARNELRWLREYVLKNSQITGTPKPKTGWQTTLRGLCEERGKGRPLQYLLGTEYFGDLEIVCKPGVLIPRPETAASITYLLSRLHNPFLPSHLRILDLCTGTGCIPLLIRHLFHSPRTTLHLHGIDISPLAIRLARLNTALLSPPTTQSSNTNPIPTFALADILAPLTLHQPHNILTANPPYISLSSFRTTPRSVRSFEPRAALVPPSSPTLSDQAQGDRFYPRLLEIADEVGAEVVLVEVADMAQALRVVGMARGRGWEGLEVWRNEPGARAEEDSGGGGRDCAGDGVVVRGRGDGRSVLCFR